nr:hypothetical protein CFP56_78350 [Quercus suber]POE80156.1 hypothetical protein CFP56_76707 [Quercus suber]
MSCTVQELLIGLQDCSFEAEVIKHWLEARRSLERGEGDMSGVQPNMPCFDVAVGVGNWRYILVEQHNGGSLIFRQAGFQML